jgi:aromatic ring-opening dioxygenase catalytic subunit (LigB family)
MSRHAETTATGWDHGVFVPFLLIHPQATTPIVQVSVLHSEDPRQHLAMGRALSALRDRNIAVVGSGFASFHNLPAMRHLMMAGGPVALKGRTDEWNAALTAALGETDRVQREERLSKWREMPFAYDMHPRHGAEHFLPLLVVAGTASDGDRKVKAYKDNFLGIDIWTYYWGDVNV